MTLVKETSFVKDSHQTSLNYSTSINKKILSTRDSFDFAKKIIAESNSDNVHLLFMNNSHNIISIIETNFNSFSELGKNTKSIAKHAINLFTPIVILIHKNNDAHKSESIKQIENLCFNLSFLDIKLLDVVIKGELSDVSYADEGYV